MKSCRTSGDQFSSSFSGNYWSFPIYIISSGKSRLLECYKPIDQTGHSSLMLLFQSYDSQFLFNGTFNSWKSGHKNKGPLIETISKWQVWQDPTIFFVVRCCTVTFMKLKIKTLFVHCICCCFCHSFPVLFSKMCMGTGRWKLNDWAVKATFARE